MASRVGPFWALMSGPDRSRSHEGADSRHEHSLVDRYKMLKNGQILKTNYQVIAV